MKKIIATAVGLMLAGGVAATTASAVESQFGGYWRTRFTYDDNMLAPSDRPTYATQTEDNDYPDNYALTNTNAEKNRKANNDTGSKYRTDTRTRLYYTAKFNDDFKFVNKFEFNTTWGDDDGGDIGADGANSWRVKNSYVDFQLGMLNSRVGIQGGTLARGFLFSDDFSGLIEQLNISDKVKIPFWYITAVDETAQGIKTGDVNIFAVSPQIMISDKLSLNPTLAYLIQTGQNTEVYWAGTDIDLTLDKVSAWGTILHNGGEKQNNDITGWLFAAGADAGIVHGQAFYATGDKSAQFNNNSDVFADDNRDTNQFQTLPGQSYYWSEIMGKGVFDRHASNGSPGDQISNIAAFNAGVTLMPMDKLTVNLDAWYAFLAVDDLNGNDELGLEFDGNVSYQLMDNLTADFILAYLVAGDATGSEDVVEGGLQLSLKF
jgi:hypothetical protein